MGTVFTRQSLTSVDERIRKIVILRYSNEAERANSDIYNDFTKPPSVADPDGGWGLFFSRIYTHRNMLYIEASYGKF